MTSHKLAMQLLEGPDSIVWLSLETQEIRNGQPIKTITASVANSVTAKPIAAPTYFTEVTISNQPEQP